MWFRYCFCFVRVFREEPVVFVAYYGAKGIQDKYVTWACKSQLFKPSNPLLQTLILLEKRAHKLQRTANKGLATIIHYFLNALKMKI